MHPPPAEGVRLDWLAVPERVRSALEQWAASAVVSAVSQRSGFSPGVAARLLLADGRRLFVTGHHPAQPWRLDELDRVLDGLVRLAEVLTPAPLPVSAVGTAADAVARQLCGWQQLRDEDGSDLARLDPWSRRHLDALATLEARAPEAVVGETLLHFDVRADNLLLAPEKVWFFDWPHARIGAGWLDVIGFAPSVTMQGGPSPDDVLARFPDAKTADPDAITAAIATVAGYFTRQALQPPPPGLPTVRAFQAAQGAVAREWLATRTGWT